MAEAPVIPSYLRRRGEFDPDPGLGRSRQEEGVVRVRTAFGFDAWLVTRLSDVRDLLADSTRISNVIPPERYSALVAEGQSAEEAERSRAGNLLATDPPDHTRLRRLLTPAFTMRRMRLLEPRVERIVGEHLDAMQRSGAPVDLVPEFAQPVPSLVICELLGVPYADRADFQYRSNRLLDLSLPPRERQEAFAQLRDYITGLVERVRSEPGDGILGGLLREHSGALTTDELVGIGTLLLIAGHETTANMLGLGTLALLRHPDQLRLVRDHPHQVEAAVEELLRWLSIVTTSLARIVTRPIELAGQRIEPGELILASLPSANRDPALIARPDVLDVTRGQVGHLAFGHGLHHCLGAPLARAELRIALPALLRRFPGLRLAHPQSEVEMRSTGFVYGVASLPVAW